jgi:ribosomal protein L37AE/L43A
MKAMNNVVQLSEYRKPRKAASADQALAQEPAPHYYCQRCDTDQFKLYATGLVHCAHCGALMRNILVSAEKTISR